MPEGMDETHKNMEEGNLMKLRKATALGLASMMTVSALAVPAAADEAKQYQTDTLQVAIWDNNQLAGLQQIADEWSEKSGVKVNIDVITWNEYWTLLEAGATGGTLPDVCWMHIKEAQKYMEAEMLLNLNDYIAQDEAIDLANYYEGIVNIYNNDGNQYALPKDHDTIALIYNKAVFDKYGVEYPTNDWNWDDYCAAAAAITQAGKDDGVYGTAMNTNDGQDGWYNFIYDFGGKLISDDNKTSGMDDEKTIAAMQRIGRQFPDCGYGAKFIQWMFSDNPQPYNSCGNGSAMRISPVGFAAHDVEEAKKLSAAVTGVTHNHPKGMKGAEATAVAIVMARQGMSKKEIRNAMEEYYDLSVGVDKYRTLWQGHGREICQESVPQALVCFFEGESYEDVIRNCISIGGDSDTIAAIAGGIAEAYYGVPDEYQIKAERYLPAMLIQIVLDFREWVKNRM